MVALRSLLKHKGYAITNTIGLTLGITAFLLIAVFAHHELSYDKFHPKVDQLYRMNNSLDFQGDLYTYPTINSAITPAMKLEIPEVEDFTRMVNFGGNNATIIRIGDILYDQQGIYTAEENFFDFFGFELLRGNEASALKEPNSIVLTESVARKLFKGADAIGEQIHIAQQVNNQPQEVLYQVTGIMADMEQPTHMNFEALISMQSLAVIPNPNPEAPPFLENWQGDGFYSYVRLNKGTRPEAILPRVRELVVQNVDEKQLNRHNPDMIAIEDIHLHSALRNEMQANGSILELIMLVVTGIFLLILAVINYMNLATARSAHRAREVGMRKIMGALRGHLIFQFLGESVLLTAFSAFLSLALASVLLPFFNQMTNKGFVPGDFMSPVILLIILLIIVIVGIGSGLYPSFFLSSFQPARVLKGAKSKGGSLTLRRILVVFQFSISILMILGTIMVYRQLNYLNTKDLGFDKELVLSIKNDNNAITPQLQTYKNELLKNPGIKSVTATLSKPGGLRPIINVRTASTPEGADLTSAGINVDFDYLETMGMRIVQGRTFNPEIATDSTEAILINEQMIGFLGLPDNPVDEVIEINIGFGPQNGWQRRRVIGVVENVNFEPLNRRTEEAFYGYLFPFYSFVLVKLSPNDMQGGIAAAKAAWEQMVPGQPFTYSFLDDDLAQMYANEERYSKIVLYCAILNVLIACLGLFGLASFTTEQRTKEIGVRKVLGASVGQIVYLIAREFILLISISFLIGAPIAWYLITDWLDQFVFHTNLSWVIFAAAFGGALLIAMLTVGYRTVKAAVSNPVKSIRYE